MDHPREFEIFWKAKKFQKGKIENSKRRGFLSKRTEA